MFISWSGKGIFGFFIFIIAFIAGLILYLWLFDSDTSTNSTHDWHNYAMWYAFASGLFVAALAMFPVGRYFWKDAQRKPMVDKKTGAEYILVTEHTLYGLHLSYFTYIYFACAILCLIFGFLIFSGIV